MIRSAFASRGRTLGFALLLALAVAAPVIQALHPPERAQLYRAVATSNGPFSFLAREFFDTTTDIDVLFLGSSISWAGIDAPSVQSALSAQLGRPSRVVSAGSNWRGEELLYYQLRDVLEHRRVKWLVFSSPGIDDNENEPHSQGYRWADLRSSPTIDGVPPLPMRQRVAEYGLLVLGGPRRWLMYVRGELGSVPNDVDTNLGARKVRGGFSAPGHAAEPFVELSIEPPAISPDEMLSTSTAAPHVRFSEQPLTSRQTHYFALINDLAHRYNVALAVLHINRQSETGSTVIAERTDWSPVFGAHVPFIGIPSQRLFAGLDGHVVRQMFYDEHLNKNGSSYFTRAITPAILKLYQDRVGDPRRP